MSFSVSNCKDTKNLLLPQNFYQKSSQQISYHLFSHNFPNIILLL